MKREDPNKHREPYIWYMVSPSTENFAIDLDGTTDGL